MHGWQIKIRSPLSQVKNICNGSTENLPFLVMHLSPELLVEVKEDGPLFIKSHKGTSLSRVLVVHSVGKSFPV